MEVRTGDDAATGVPGDTAATFTAWVRPHWDHLVRFAQRMIGPGEADDVVQEALAAAWRSRARFDPARGEPRTWLLAIVANKAKNHRAGTRMPDLPTADLGHPADDRSTSVLDLERALAQLTERQRAAVTLHYYLGLSTDECARVLDCAGGTVKSTLSDARRRLADILGGDYR